MTRAPGPFPETAHGTRSRYVRGCRCEPCTIANRDYARARYLEKAQGRGNPLVSTARARRHLRKLQRGGIGTRTVSDVTGCSRSIVCGIRDGSREQCRRTTEARILDMAVQAWSDGQLIDAGPTWRLLDELLERGFTRGALAAELGSRAKMPSLQLDREVVTARNAMKVRKLYAALSRGREEPGGTWDDLVLRVTGRPVDALPE